MTTRPSLKLATLVANQVVTSHVSDASLEFRPTGKGHLYLSFGVVLALGTRATGGLIVLFHRWTAAETSRWQMAVVQGGELVLRQAPFETLEFDMTSFD